MGTERKKINWEMEENGLYNINKKKGVVSDIHLIVIYNQKIQSYKRKNRYSNRPTGSVNTV